MPIKGGLVKRLEIMKLRFSEKLVKRKSEIRLNTSFSAVYFQGTMFEVRYNKLLQLTERNEEKFERK